MRICTTTHISGHLRRRGRAQTQLAILLVVLISLSVCRLFIARAGCARGAIPRSDGCFMVLQDCLARHASIRRNGSHVQ
jgi:hypothetical protein